MGGQPAPGIPGQKRQLPERLLYSALVLAIISAILHLYIGLVAYGIPLGVPLVLIALVYLGGTVMIATNYHRSLWLRVAIGWVALVIVLWALSAAVDAPNTRSILAYLSKAVEVLLLALLILQRKSK